ncbi:MAG: ribonuclease Z [Bacteroidia bacterium]|nr:MAG: ribonuclease Z [Bacteroidia bacterium]
MSFSLRILGSNSSLPTSKRFSTAHLLNVNERFFLIDCGEGTQIQLRRYKAKFSRLNHVFISHLHGDHYFGIFGLLSTFTLLGRKHDLHIYAPPDLEQMLKAMFSYTDAPSYGLVFHHTNHRHKEIIYEDKRMTVETIPLKHRIPTTGFLFREKPKMRNMIKDIIPFYKIPIKEIVAIKQGKDFVTENGVLIPNSRLTTAPPKPKSYAFCSDTAYNEKIIEQIKGVDLLYHEATFAKDMIKRAKETKHSTAEQAAELARKAEVKNLLIGHYSARYRNPQTLLDEAKKIFPRTIAAEDGLLIDFENGMDK